MTTCGIWGLQRLPPPHGKGADLPGVLRPLCTGTLLIYAFFAMILYFNSGSFTPGELAGLANCALVVLVLSLFLYGMYRFTLGRVCSALSIRSSSRPR